MTQDTDVDRLMAFRQKHWDQWMKFLTEIAPKEAEQVAAEVRYDELNETDPEDWEDEDREFMSKHDDHCDECGERLSEDDYTGEYEDRGEFWGSPCQEHVCTGYTCKGCGHSEYF